MSGRIAQLRLQAVLGDALAAFHGAGGHILGICNGFQILSRLGLLPAGSLIENASGRFQCQWARLEVRDRRSPFLAKLPDAFELPVAHAEGRFVAPDDLAATYLADGLAPLTYPDEVNGSQAGIAALQSPDGRVFGLMPHPERFLHPRHHYDPDWAGHPTAGWGRLFFDGVAAALA